MKPPLRLPFRWIDAIATSLFRGNPAAVVLLDAWLDDATLLAIAAENGLSETAFVIPRTGRSPLRWLTPTVEVDLCGHATLAAAHVLFRECFPSLDKLEFETRSGLLGVERDGPLLFLDFPALAAEPCEATATILEAVGEAPRELFRSRDLVAVFETEEQVARFEPDFAKIAAVDAFALIVTAPGRDVDFVSRFFAPAKGVPEDPVTGSAHCTLIPYWATRLGKNKLAARQLSRRGGELVCEHRGERVRIGGAAVEYLRGEIHLPG